MLVVVTVVEVVAVVAAADGVSPLAEIGGKGGRRETASRSPAPPISSSNQIFHHEILNPMFDLSKL